MRFTGDQAAATISRIADAPIGGGPNAPGHCLPEVAYGDGAIVLRITSDQGVDEVVLRYDDCDGHGFDDGTVVRTLTRAATLPIVSGSNQLSSWDHKLSAIVYAGPTPSTRPE